MKRGPASYSTTSLVAREAEFRRTRFADHVIFYQSRFRGTLDLGRARFVHKRRLCLSFNQIEELRMDGDHLGGGANTPSSVFPRYLLGTSLYQSRIRSAVEGENSVRCVEVDASEGAEVDGQSEPLDAIYKTVEESFQKGGDRVGANEAWYLGLLASRGQRGSKARIWIEKIFLDFPSRYGIDLLRVWLVSVVVVTGFAVVYFLYFQFLKDKGIDLRVHLALPDDRKRTLRLRLTEPFLVEVRNTGRQLHPFRDAVFLSGRAYFKLSIGTVYPMSVVLKLLTGIEWLVGAYMAGHLVVALKNTIPMVLLLF